MRGLSFKMTLSHEVKVRLIEFKEDLVGELKQAGWKPAGNPKTKIYTSWTRGLRKLGLAAPCPTKTVHEMRLTIWAEGHGEYVWHPEAGYDDWNPFFFRNYVTDTIQFYEGFDDWIQTVREFIQ